jgi:Fe-S-cluster containining protein
MPTLHVKLSVAGHDIEAAVSVPEGPAPRRVLLPILHGLTNTIVSIAENTAAAEGRSISCRKGCDACCRQMVPISKSEAFHLAQTIDTLDPASRARIYQKFEVAEAKLDALGLLSRLNSRHTLTARQQQQLDIDYFAAQIPCPLLHKKSCSIHSSRPLACREYAVTSPRENCLLPTADRITQLPLSAKVSTAFRENDDDTWIPLTLARQHLAAHLLEPQVIPAGGSRP